MKLLIIQTPEYDFCVATLIEGLSLYTLVNDDVEFMCSEKSNYAQENWTQNENEIISYGKSADYIILTSNNRVREYLIEQIDPEHKKTIYLDGEDVSYFKKNPVDFIFYFKRELMLTETMVNENVFCFPFAAELRYFSEVNFDKLWESKDIDLICSFGPHDNTKPWRQEIENTLSSMKLLNAHIGQIYGNNIDVIDTGNRNHRNYYELLKKSRIAIDAYGAFGCQSGRLYESLANGCCLITQSNRIQMPYNFVDTEDVLEFKNMDELRGNVEYLLKSPEVMKKMARSGFEHLCKHHTTLARAQYFLKVIKGEYDTE